MKKSKISDKKFDRFNRSRLGQIGLLMTLIIVLAGAIIIFIFIGKFTNNNRLEQAINTCRFSVLSQTATELAPTATGAKSPFDLHCDRRFITFKGTEADIGLSPENTEPMKVVYEGKQVKKFTKMNEDVAYQVLAEELRICKFEFADGKIELFPNNDNLFAGDQVCYVCSEITFDSDTVDQAEYNNLKKYTMDTTYSDAQVKYYAYLTENNFAGLPMWSQATLPADDAGSDMKIDTSKKYVVYVSEYVPEKIINYKEITGKREANIDVSVRSVDDINKNCDVQAN